MWAIQGSEFMFQTQKPAVWVKIGKLFVFFFITDLKRGTPKQMFAVTYAHTQTHLPVENNAPDEPENQFVIPINDVCRSNVHQINLQRGSRDTKIWWLLCFPNTQTAFLTIPPSCFSLTPLRRGLWSYIKNTYNLSSRVVKGWYYVFPATQYNFINQVTVSFSCNKNAV